MDRIRIGISSCLLGEQVRYDGGHKLDRYLRDTLGRTVDFVPVCPEVQCGLSVPREPMHLEGTAEAPRLIITGNRHDLTGQMASWSGQRLELLAGEGLCGFIFKCRSPSCGLAGVSLLNRGRTSGKTGRGIFAGLLIKRFPHLPVIDEEQIRDQVLGEAFLSATGAVTR